MNGAGPTDLVVVLPGITGSALYKEGKPVWEPSAGAIVNALLTFGRSISSLKLPEGIGDQAPDDGVHPGGLINDVHVIPGVWTPVRGYSPLIAKLEGLGYREGTTEQPGNLLPMPYDWRLSNRYTASWMAPAIQEALERWRAQGGRYAEAQVVFVCHSMGGLVARWYATHLGRDHTRMIITLGTPMRGSMNALDNLAHGTATKLGPLGRKFTEVSSSLPSLHQLLPAYACVVEGNEEPDYLDPASCPILTR